MDIAIIGGGGHALVIIDAITEINKYDKNKYNIVGIYDDNLRGYILDIKVLGQTDNMNNKYKYIIGIGDIKIRNNIFEKNKNLQWVTIIHPKSIISDICHIGKGTFIGAGAIIQIKSKIGKHCIINTNCNIDHESSIGNFCNISPSVSICGKVTLENNIFVGANTCIIENISVKSFCTIGANSLVLKNINEPGVYVGNPIKKIK
jgi:sugar O-acyltransferase (sialic acid O-acetyltransferase NeuD family)